MKIWIKYAHCILVHVGRTYRKRISFITMAPRPSQRAAMPGTTMGTLDVRDSRTISTEVHARLKPAHSHQAPGQHFSKSGGCWFDSATIYTGYCNSSISTRYLLRQVGMKSTMLRLAQTFRSHRVVRDPREDWRCEASLTQLGRPGCQRASGLHLRSGPASATKISQAHIRITHLYLLPHIHLYLGDINRKLSKSL